MFVLTVLEKIKEARLKFSQGKITVLQKMVNYEEAWVKLTNSRLKILNSAAKSKTRKTLKIRKTF